MMQLGNNLCNAK